MNVDSFLSWIEKLFTELAKVGEWINTPINIGGFISITPIYLFTFGGLMLFVAAAIIKWVAS